MRQPVPGPARRRSTAASRSIAVIALCALALPITGCAGGSAERAPRSDVAVKKSTWVFPLYSYSRTEERKTVRPLFLFPISYGGGDPSVETADARGGDRLSGADAPLWNDSSASGGPRSAEAVAPGVWGSSLPQPRATEYVDAGPTGGGREHEVRAGETLYAISRRYYGTGSDWTKIAEANRDRVPSPQALPIGARLRIP